MITAHAAGSLSLSLSPALYSPMSQFRLTPPSRETDKQEYRVTRKTACSVHPSRRCTQESNKNVQDVVLHGEQADERGELEVSEQAGREPVAEAEGEEGRPGPVAVLLVDADVAVPGGVALVAQGKEQDGVGGSAVYILLM